MHPLTQLKSTSCRSCTPPGRGVDKGGEKRESEATTTFTSKIALPRADSLKAANEGELKLNNEVKSGELMMNLTKQQAGFPRPLANCCSLMHWQLASLPSTFSFLAASSALAFAVTFAVAITAAVTSGL